MQGDAVNTESFQTILTACQTRVNVLSTCSIQLVLSLCMTLFFCFWTRFIASYKQVICAKGSLVNNKPLLYIYALFRSPLSP